MRILTTLIVVIAGLSGPAKSAIFTITGPSPPALVVFDPSSLQIVSGSPNSAPGVGGIAFDPSGRLFASRGNQLYEYEPSTGLLLNAGRQFEGAANGLAATSSALFALTGSASNPGIARFSLDSLEALSGAPTTSVSGIADLAFSPTGRLFGSYGNQLFEFDPLSGSVMNAGVPFGGAINGLAATSENLFALTGGAGNPGIVTITLNSLRISSGSPTSVSGIADLAFAPGGRLFGSYGNQLFEFDPLTGSVINAGPPIAGGVNGLAIPEPNLPLLLCLALAPLASRRRSP